MNLPVWARPIFEGKFPGVQQCWEQTYINFPHMYANGGRRQQVWGLNVLALE